MFAAVCSFDLRDLSKFNFKVVSEFMLDGRLYFGETGSVKFGTRQITELRQASSFLAKLHRIEPIEARVMHIERGEGNSPARGTDQELLFAAHDVGSRSPRILQGAIGPRIGQPHVITRPISYQWHSQ